MKKSTDDLFKEMTENKTMKTIGDYEKYHKRNAESFQTMKLCRALMSLIEQKKLTKAAVIKLSGINSPTYGYQILDGRKVNPDRDKVLMLCIGMGATVEETQSLLKVTGYAPLYAKNERDNFILYSINNKYSIIDINNELMDLGLKILE